MSNPLRIGLIAEGPTDKIVLEAVLTSILVDRPFIFRQLLPEESLPFGEMGTGWCAVYKWCQGMVKRSGNLRNDILFLTYDILILHLDADVADKHYNDCNIQDLIQDLPCTEPCPPSSATTNKLRNIILRWIGETGMPAKTLLCTPSKSMEAWVIASLFPNDIAMRRGIECWPNIEARLGQQPINQRIRKRPEDYRERADHFRIAWPRLVDSLFEAKRFHEEFLSLIP